MELKATHELHKRRFSRNLGVALTLVAFIAVTYSLTIVKIGRGAQMQGYDYVVRPELTENEVTE